MKPLLAVILLLLPLVLAFGMTRLMCQPFMPVADACPATSEQFRSVFLSYSIMFAIAIWVGGGLCYALLKLPRGTGE